MVEVLKHVFENIDEVGCQSSPTRLSKVTGLQKALARECLQIELSYTLRQNHMVRGNHQGETKALFSLHIMQADLSTLNEIRRRHNTT